MTSYPPKEPFSGRIGRFSQAVRSWRRCWAASSSWPAGLIAVSAGLIDKREDRRPEHHRASRSRTTRLSRAPTVNEIYKQDGPGRRLHPRPRSCSAASRHSASRRTQRGEATGSGFVIDKTGTSSPTRTSSRARARSTVGFGDNKTRRRQGRRQGREQRRRAAEGDAGKDQLHPLDARRLRPTRRSATRSSRSATRSGSTAPSRPAS